MAKKKTQPAGETERDAMTFEQALERLDRIVQRLEGGQLTLTESLTSYEHAIKYLRYCNRQLERVERKIELLSGVDATGQAKTQPFDETSMTLEEKQAARSRRRSGSPAPCDPDAEMDGGNTLF